MEKPASQRRLKFLLFAAAALFLAVVLVAIVQGPGTGVFTQVGMLGFSVAFISLLVFFAAFFFVVVPVTRALDKANSKLSEISETFSFEQAKNRVNMDHITRLQDIIEEKEREFRERVEDAVDAIFEYDFNGYFTYANLNGEKLSGYTEEELKKKFYYELIAPGYRQDLITLYEEQFNNRTEVSHREFPIVRKTGEAIWIAQTIRMVFKNDRLEKVHAVSRDITRVRSYRQSLQQSERRFKALSENAKIGIHETDKEGNVVYRNQIWDEISGFAHVSGSVTRIDLIHPDDREGVLAEWTKGFRERKHISLRFRFQHPVRGDVWVISHTTPIRDEEGMFRGYIGTLTDITDMQLAFQRMEKSEETYRLISTNAKDLIALYRNDEASTRLFLSPSVKHILGFEPMEMEGRSVLDLILPEDVVKLQRDAHASTLSGNSAYAEFRIRKKDGTIIWMESNSHPFFDAKGEMIGFQTSSRDITERKMFEQELLGTKEKAEEANASKSRFLSMMSHEIRTPMNAIVGLTNFLIEEGASEKQMENLRLIKFSGENLLEIINDILDFSKIEAGKLELEEVAFDLIDLIENISKMMLYRVREKGLSYALEYDEDLPRFVKGDSVRLQQILINLIGNAVKFTEKGSVAVAVRKRDMQPGGDEIVFSISDTGIGIEKDKIEFIFESFSQANKDTTRKFGGTGLGLTITRNLVRLMRGDIDVTSEPGKGSEFSFTISLKRAKPIDGKTTMRELKGAGTGQVFDILLVEDNPVNQIVASNFLAKWGLRVTIANNGAEALEMVRDRRWHLILMDLQMPVMDGYEASLKIRQMEDAYFKNIPIIALSASASKDKSMMRGSGINEFVTKPFKTEELHQKIFSFLEPIRESQLDLSAYTQNDPEQENVFRKFMADNLVEVVASLDDYKTGTPPTRINQTLHKAKTTFSILNSPSLTGIVEEMLELINVPSMSFQVVEPKIDRLRELCNVKIKELSRIKQPHDM